eukprot:CAMPEP_0181491820 /NCGR_PEP_ID=MMETSP1110-20121109/50346_1 /TAXON_ID=174948 /ORGANISM="Symbiodinium sp., Strain CCMP421" /LENGTH=463 /DNA_ID=CAMNT_0023618999 /DNA_START=112 /DNA_END=1504 /DNA_ORIENTATION=-
MIVERHEVDGMAFIQQEAGPSAAASQRQAACSGAYRLGRWWFAAIFAISALLSFVYEVLHQELLPLQAAGVWLRLLDHGGVYFCCLQLGFVVLGPEDPTIEQGKLDGNALDLVAARVVPALAMSLFLLTRSSWLDFHWQCMILLDVLWLLGFAGFWLQPARRHAATEVLLRSRYWLRLWKQAIAPTAVISVFLVGLSSVSPAPSACRAVLAVLGTKVLHTVASHSQGEKLRESQRLQELQGLSPSWNPVVAKQLLAAPGVLGVSTVGASLASDFMTSEVWRWPLLSMATGLRPGGYVVVLGALPALMAMAAALWLVSSTGSCHAIDEEVSTQLGCLLGYLSLLLGVLAMALHCFELPLQQTLSLSFCFSIMVLAMWTLALGTSRRCVWASSILSGSVLLSFVALLLLDQQLIPNQLHIPLPALACAEYLSVAVYLLWPLGWAKEVDAGWQLHKAWRSRPIQMA